MVPFPIFLQTLKEAHQQFHIEIHAYCLMDNHYHLLIKTPGANLSRAMRHVNGVYTQRYNQRNKTDGPLFRGRYKAILVDSDAYLLHLSKYIHLNPLTAKMVESLELYKWSSYLAYTNQVKPASWLIQEEIYAQITLSNDKPAHYKLFMNNEELNKNLFNFYNQSNTAPVLGDESFVRSLPLRKPSKEVPQAQQVTKRPTISAILSEVANTFDTQPSDLLIIKRGRQNANPARKMAIYIARKYGDYHLLELANTFGFMHAGGVSHAVHTFSREIKNAPELKKCVASVLEKLKTDLTP